MSWHFLQGPEGEYSEVDSLDGTPFAPSRLTSTAERYCSPGSATESCRDSQSGMISKPSTAEHGAERLISSQADSLARTSAQPEKAKESPGNEAVFGLRWPELSVRFSRATHSWKIHPCLFQGDLMSCSVTLPRWGMMRDGELSERITPVLPTIATESGYMLPTPQAQDAKHSTKNAKNMLEKGGQLHLAHVVGLEEIGELNPEWIEWLMGWPIGWTALEPLATGRFRQWLDSHGICSQDNRAEKL